MRIKFEKGKQKEFFKKIINKTNSPSLRSLNQRGIEIPYPTLKSYYQEHRLLPENLFNDLCTLSKFNPVEFKIKFLPENWGKIKGGKIKNLH